MLIKFAMLRLIGPDTEWFGPAPKPAYDAKPPMTPGSYNVQVNNGAVFCVLSGVGPRGRGGAENEKSF